MALTATLTDRPARITRPEAPCCSLHHGDAVRILGGSDIVLVVAVGHLFVLVLDADLAKTPYLPEQLGMVS